MEMNNNLFDVLQKKIELAEKANQPVESYVRQQIELLEAAHDEFISQAQHEGYSLEHPRVGEIEIQQYNAMKQLAKKIGIPYEKYDELIREVQVRIFGEDITKQYFD
jgi:hypothetical protein